MEYISIFVHTHTFAYQSYVLRLNLSVVLFANII